MTDPLSDIQTHRIAAAARMVTRIIDYERSQGRPLQPEMQARLRAHISKAFEHLPEVK